MYAAYMTEPGNVEFGVNINSFNTSQILPKPKPAKGQVLVKVESAPVGFGDLDAIDCTIPNLFYNYPLCPGWEASGTVVENGGGIHGWYLMGKRVTFTRCMEPVVKNAVLKINGVWAQYAITNAFQCLPIDDEVDWNTASCVCINPFTAIGLTEEITKNKQRSVVLTAGASALGRMLIRRFNNLGVEVIATVRKEEHVKELQEEYKLTHVLNSEDEDFREKLGKITEEVGCKYLLECVSGKVAGDAICSMPKGSMCILYGKICPDNIIGLDPYLILGNQLTIRGWMLNDWFESKNLLQLIWLFRKIKKGLNDEFKVSFSKEYDLKDINEAIDYYKDHMSDGKVILKPFGLVEEKEQT